MGETAENPPIFPPIWRRFGRVWGFLGGGDWGGLGRIWLLRGGAALG